MKQSYEYKKACLIFLTGLLIFSLFGCSSSGNGNYFTLRGTLIEAPNVISTVTAAQLDGIIINADLQTLAGNAKCDVTVAQINYRTIGVQAGEVTNASGVVLIPGGVQVFVPFEITSWQKVYGNLYHTASDVFNSPYDSYIETLFPTLLTPADLANLLPGGTPAQARDAMFVASYLNDLATNPNNATIIAGKKQDLLGWNPQAPTTLCGGLHDPTVKFPINAQAAYDDFTSRGGANVTLVDVDPEIQQKYGSVLASNPTLYWSSYHGTYESPFCSRVAKELFDLCK